MPVQREVIESPMPQGVDEVISYSLDTTPWGGSPSAVECSVFDVTDRGYVLVTDDVMPVNDPSIDANTITLSPLLNLTEGSKYRIEVQWTNAGNTFEAYCIINAEL